MEGYFDNTLGAFHTGPARGGFRGAPRMPVHNSSFRPGRSFAVLHGFGSGGHARLRALHYWRHQMMNQPFGGGPSGGGDSSGQPGGGDSGGGLTMQQLEQEIQQLEQQLAAPGGAQHGGGKDAGEGGDSSLGAFHFGRRFGGGEFEPRPGFHPGAGRYDAGWNRRPFGFIPPRRHIDWRWLLDKSIRTFEDRHLATPIPSPEQYGGPISRYRYPSPEQYGGPVSRIPITDANPPAESFALNTPTDANPPADSNSMGDWRDDERRRREQWERRRRGIFEQERSWR